MSAVWVLAVSQTRAVGLWTGMCNADGQGVMRFSTRVREERSVVLLWWRPASSGTTAAYVMTTARRLPFQTRRPSGGVLDRVPEQAPERVMGGDHPGRMPSRRLGRAGPAGALGSLPGPEAGRDHPVTTSPARLRAPA